MDNTQLPTTVDEGTERHYPRTLQEAFGPYTDRRLVERSRHQPPVLSHEWVLYVLAVVALIVVIWV